MPARRKTLTELARDGTFLARRHASRLHETLDLPRPDLRALQATYLAAPDDAARRAIAFAFEAAVRSGSAAPKRALTIGERWYAAIGPGAGAVTGLDELGMRRRDGTVDWQAFERLERRWIYWNRRHGCYWRAKQMMLNNGDKLKLARMLTGRRRLTVPAAEAALSQLGEDELARAVAAREPIPDPPGIELLAGAGTS